MKFIQLFIAALVLSLHSLNAQLADKWSASFSNPNGPGSLDYIDAITDSYGNTYVLTTAFTGSDYDAILIKFDADGNKDWDVEYTSAYGDSEDHGVALVFDASENVYVLVNINPDDASDSSQPNGYSIHKYNSSGTELANFEDVNDATVKFGAVAYDVGFKNSQIFVTSSRISGSNGFQARLKRLSTSLSVSATATYDTSGDDIAGQVYLPDDGSSELFWMISEGTNVIWRYYSVNFANGSSTSFEDVVYNIGSEVATIHKAVGQEDIYGELADGRYFIAEIGESKVIFSSAYTINDAYKSGANVYVTGSKTISTHEELLFSAYSGGVMQFEYYLDESHGSLNSSGKSIYDNGEITIGGNLINAGSNYPGTVTFDSDGQIISSPYLGTSSENVVAALLGAGADNTLIANSGNSIALYSQCSPPTADLGEDFTSNEGDTETLGSDLPSGMTYSWSTGATSKTIDVTEDGTYSITVTNANGCSASDDITVDFLLPAPDAPTMLHPTIEDFGSPYADIGIHWTNDDPLATSHVVTQLYPDLGSEFASYYSSTTDSKVIQVSSATYARFRVAARNDDDVTGGSTTYFSLNGCNEYTMQELETYLINLTVAGQESIGEGSSGIYSLTGFTPGDDELKSFFEWTFPTGWEITEYSPVMVKVDVTGGASSGQVSVVIRNACTGESTAAITKTIYAIKDQSITFDQPMDMQVGDDPIDLGALASSGLEVSYALNNANGELDGSMFTPLHAGTVVVTASQAGNSEYNAADDVERTITINKGDDAIIFTDLEDVLWSDSDFDLDDLASSTSGRQITWSGNNSSVATVTSIGVVNPTFPGDVTIAASLSADDDWNAASNVEQVLMVTKADQTITFDPLPAKTEGDQNFNLSAFASASSGLTLSYVSNNTSAVSISTGQAVIEGPGTATITASQSGNEYYFAAPDAEQSITVTEGTYIWEDGIWNLGESSSPSLIPDNTDNVEIRENYAFSIQGTFAAKNLTVTESGAVSVNNESTLEVKENLTNNGSLTIQAGSSLITYDGNTIADNITIKRNTRYSDGKYSFVGTPVEQDASINGADLGSHVYKYDETASSDPNSLGRWIDASTDELVPGYGYTQADQKPIEFVGTPNDGMISYTASDDNDGYHLVSNPYPAALDVDEFIDGNPATTETIYIWDDNGSDTGRRTNSDYIVATKSGATDNGDPDVSRWNGHIGSMQGFFIQMDGSAGTVTFTEDMRVSGNNADVNFYRTSDNSKPLARINLTNEEGLFKQAVIAWNESVSDTELAKGYDGKVFSTTGTDMLYTMKGEHALAIQTITRNREVIPLTYQVEKAGVYTIQVNLEEAQGQLLYLRDKHSDETINLNSGSYSFNTNAGQFTDRFELVTNSRVLGLDEYEIQVYAHEQTVYISMPEGEERIFQLLSLGGQQLLTQKLDGSAQIQTNLPSGVYIVTDGEQSYKVILK